MTNQEFVDYIAPIIKRIGNSRGYGIVSATIAQAIIESNYNKSSLSKKYNNFFGMKAGKSWGGKVVNLKTKEEYKVGVLTTITDGFRVYDTPEEGIKGYYDFISSKRYANLKGAKNHQEFAQMLKSDGYATSSTYVNTLCNTVSKWNLQKYDTGVVMARKLLKKNMVDDDVAYLHSKLRELHYDVNRNSRVFNDLTEQCVRHLQAANNLVVDGIVGPKTWSVIDG